MLNLINYLKIYGFTKFVLKLLRYPFLKIYRYNMKKNIYNSKDPKIIFTNIYNYNWWGSAESKSGVGSTYINTSQVRKKLEQIIVKYKIKSIFDAPCGDLNWIQHIIKKKKIIYEGWDIVDDLIISNQNKYKNHQFFQFKCKDITVDKYPKADLMICRDCFIHFSYKDIKETLIKFIESDIKYILLSNYENLNNFENKDIMTGEARIFDLFKFPFSFKKIIWITEMMILLQMFRKNFYY